MRLTYNFARKGGYSGVKDYRWPVLRASMRPWQFQLFNVFFIVLDQNFLLVLITLPAWTAYQDRASAFGPVDALLAVVFPAFTVGETIADQQQWDFQARKRSELAGGRAAYPQFVQSFLFRYSRHPNYFFELVQWWVLFLLGAAAGTLIVWTVLGPVLSRLLFVGSTSFTEKIFLSHWPEYAHYKRSTSAVVPWFPRPSALTVQSSDAE